jgi:hypothetical protein
MKECNVSIETGDFRKLSTSAQRAAVCFSCGKTIFSSGKDYFRVSLNSFCKLVCGDCGQEGVLKALKALKDEALPRLLKEASGKIRREVQKKYAPLIRQESAQLISGKIAAIKSSFYKVYSPVSEAVYTARQKKAGELIEKKCSKCGGVFTGEVWKDICPKCWHAAKENEALARQLGSAGQTFDRRITALADSRGMKELHQHSVRYRR